jgi:hypothetical protein
MATNRLLSSTCCVVCVQAGVADPLRAEGNVLKKRLEEVSASLRDATALLDNVTEERDQLQFQLSRLDEKLVKKEMCDAHLCLNVLGLISSA